MKNKLLLWVFIILLLLAACSDEVFRGKNSSEDNYSDLAKNFATSQPKGYNVLVNTVEAKSVLDYKKIDIPEKVNNLDMTCIRLLDESTLLIGLFNRDVTNKHKEIGIYNFVENTYEKYFAFDQIYDDRLSEVAYYVSAISEKYMVIRVTRNNWANTSIYLYNIENDTVSKMYDYSVDEKNGRDVYMNNNSILIQGNNIYFDDFSYNELGEITVNLFKYDCVSGEISLVAHEAQNPMLYNGNLVYFTKNQNGKFKKIQTLDESIIIDITIELIEVFSSGDSIYCIENKYTDDKEMTTEFQIQDFIHDRRILYTKRGLGWLDVNEYFITWYDYEKNIPCIYSVDMGSLLVFSDIPEGINRVFVKDEFGLLLHKSGDIREFYFFRKKK